MSHPRGPRGGAGPPHQLVQEHGAHAAVSVAGRPFVGDAEHAGSRHTPVGRRDAQGRRERAAEAGDGAVHPHPARELVDRRDLRAGATPPGQLPGEAADPVRDPVQGVRRGHGTDSGIDQGTQLVPQRGDGRPFLLQSVRSRLLGDGARRGGVVRGRVHRVFGVSLWCVSWLGPVRRIRSRGISGAASAPVSGVWCVQLQGGGGRRRDGGPPGRAKSRVGESATDDNAADVRARPRVRDMIRRTGPRSRRVRIRA